jgi:hypothetical protein
MGLPASFVPFAVRQTGKRRLCMARGKKHAANGKSMAQACKEAEIVEQTIVGSEKLGGLRVDYKNAQSSSISGIR